ncbi:flagellar hook-basal body complex protein [Neobacillus vireti]|uniref:Flagellar hook protein FlgE n=1 Tax=Neobacillus vireti LMG 21834 TaxID=1131730 RepID=A0AB94IL33_9BACI|nr:flagellar hook-basal body complex protein [Neobacillus vireti]ETI67707.1 flagellar hook protein FlgE [Neobacillus vireti LMG 21834]KLT19790.1 flagellar basal body rod protein FlgG [Neobacillus vireti]
MLNSLYSGVSGMKGSQTKLDVIGNNIANVNTVGFKKGRVVFQDIINRNIGGAVAPTNVSGGVNPMQVGLGTRIASIDTVHTPGSPMSTYVGTDLAIDGEAFFVVSPENGGPNYLTKAGNFTRDANGYIVNSNGFFVMGVVQDEDGNPVTKAIKIVEDETINQDGTGASGTDSDEKHMKFTSYSIDPNGYIIVVREDGKSGKLAMNDEGKYYMNDSDDKLNENISIGTAVVANPGGLTKVGNTMFAVTGNSGEADLNRIEDNKGGTVISGVLEMSNVDLTEEFTEMIIAQRGFQANARTITTSDSILEEIVNLKR